MAERVTSFLTIVQIVKSFMSERGEKTLANFERYCNMAIEGYSDMSVFEMNTVEVAYIPINSDTNTALLPPDFITYSKIAFRKCGRLFTLTLNNDIALPPPESICPVEVEDVCETTECNGGYYFAPHYRYGAYIDALFAQGGGFNRAYYRVDMSTRTIVFSGHVPNDEIVLEYKSSQVKAGGALIPRQAAMALKAYLHWRSIEFSGSYSQSDKERKERQYYSELRKLKSLECSFTMSEMMDALWEGYQQGIKR